jgi:hypothetical protein
MIFYSSCYPITNSLQTTLGCTKPFALLARSLRDHILLIYVRQHARTPPLESIQYWIFDSQITLYPLPDYQQITPLAGNTLSIESGNRPTKNFAETTLNRSTVRKTLQIIVDEGELSLSIYISNDPEINEPLYLHARAAIA